MDTIQQKSKLPLILFIIAVLVFIYVFPRILLSLWGPSDPWTCYLYQYGFGAITFGIGIFLILKSGSCKLGRGNDTHWFKWIILGFFLFAITHAVWILLSLYIPVKGGI
ncbi:MAG: hypothetical protein P9L97_08570 [Candidatus Tenebribacter davisii]|jgi:membrane protease YdiL (CAAX protease family)|nr:hypothetical protein [Candidatus Tenebribacter davisii]